MKKGFTLIELLAVIVILAIIALIATPIVLNIINETKESASLRSAEMYLDAVEQPIMRAQLKGIRAEGTYNILTDGTLCRKNLEENETCPTEDMLVVEIDGETPSSGNIDIKNGNIGNVLIEINNKKMTTNDKGEVIAHPCTLVEDADDSKSITPGDKYECKVDPNKDPYTFYVLSYSDKYGNITEELSNATSINLIMDSNINKLGVAIKSNSITDKGSVAWNTVGSNSGGPVTAMTYLYNATKTWTNVPPLNYEYKDKEWQESLGVTFGEGSGYESFTSVDGVGKINGTKFTQTEPLRARMSIYTEINGEHGEVANLNESNAYLYNYMDELGGISSGEIAISGIYGYWTLSSRADYYGDAWIVYYEGKTSEPGNDDYVGYDVIGVRPVINLKL